MSLQPSSTHGLRGGREEISLDQWAEIRRLHRVDGMSIRGISRRLGLARETTALSAPRVGSGVDERRGTQTRSASLPTDFGDRVPAAATALPLPTEEDIQDPRARRKARLETLQAQALVHNLRATALRAGHVCRLTRADPKLADQVDSHLRIEMAKIAFAAHVVFGKDVQAAIEAYLRERNDTSPWLFIQHGRTGAGPKK